MRATSRYRDWSALVRAKLFLRTSKVAADYHWFTISLVVAIHILCLTKKGDDPRRSVETLGRQRYEAGTVTAPSIGETHLKGDDL